MKHDSTVGIIGAMDIEIARLTAALDEVREEIVAGLLFYVGKLKQRPVIVVKSGIGKVNAARCTQLLIDHYHVHYIVNTGIAGGLDPTLSIGDIVIADGLVQHDFDLSAFGYARGYLATGINKDRPTIFHPDETVSRLLEESAAELISADKIKTGCIATGDQFISDPAKKETIKATFSAMAVEMESCAIAQVASQNGIPFAIIRAISDLADGTASQSYEVFEAEAAELSAAILKHLLTKLDDDQ